MLMAAVTVLQSPQVGPQQAKPLPLTLPREAGSRLWRHPSASIAEGHIGAGFSTIRRGLNRGRTRV